MKKNLFLLFLFFSVHANAQESRWCLVTDSGQLIEMSRVGSLVATDTEETFSILGVHGNVLAKNVSKASFSWTDSPIPTGVQEITEQDNMLESLVDNVLTLIGVKGNIEIFSVNGSIMLSMKATGQETRINVSHFTPGVYLVKCGKQSFRFTKK